MLDMEIESLLNTIIKKLKNHIKDCKQADLSDSQIWDDHIHNKKEKEYIQLFEEFKELKNNHPLEINSTKFIEAEELLQELHNELLRYSTHFKNL